jgi:hypothetical protein
MHLSDTTASSLNDSVNITTAPEEAFWHWNSFSIYLYFIFIVSAALFIVNFFLGHIKEYQVILGTLSAAIEVNNFYQILTYTIGNAWCSTI